MAIRIKNNKNIEKIVEKHRVLYYKTNEIEYTGKKSEDYEIAMPFPAGCFFSLPRRASDYNESVQKACSAGYFPKTLSIDRSIELIYSSTDPEKAYDLFRVELPKGTTEEQAKRLAEGIEKIMKEEIEEIRDEIAHEK